MIRDPIYVSTSVSDTDGSPASDLTPAMPLLDDVKAKSRTILRNIGSGSRPVSAEFSIGEVEDMMNAMYRVESDNSVDADEPIMKHMTEGGVTILKQIDRKRRPVPVEPHRYSFPVKRILVTRDAKDKSITGSGLGLKIVGGQETAGNKELGAYVTAIYPIIADQLHGELDVGDQVLEWNGTHLTGLSSEEVQDVISNTSGEIEMVVKVQLPPLQSTVGLSTQHESRRSSYDNHNLPTYEEALKEPLLLKPKTRIVPATSRQGVDPRLLAAQLEGIQESSSPADNSPSSSKDVVTTTPSVSSHSSTPRSENTSTSSDRQKPTSSAASVAGDRAHREVKQTASDWHTNKHRHSPLPEKPHSQKQLQQQQPPTLPQHQQQPQLHLTTNQQQPHHSKTELSPPNHASTSKSKTNRRKQRETPNLPVISVPDKPRPSVVVDQSENNVCSSPAFNDRLRASPPLDYRLSVRSKVSKKTKDNFIFPSKAIQETEKGEDYGLGEMQLQISHDDYDNILNIHVIQARNLRPQDLNGLSDPFVKLYLLPGRGQENKRRTKHIARTLNPEWHQTVIFQDVARLELQNRVLEITVWDYDRFKTNDFLGELIIELKDFAFLDNKPHWYPLKEHVMIHSFELPKSTVSPPKPAAENGLSKSGSPRNAKKLGVSSLHPRESNGKYDEDSQRRRSLGTISGNGADQESVIREVSSATNSPLPSRRPMTSRHPIKTRTKGPLYR